MFTVQLINLYLVNKNQPEAMHISDKAHSLFDVHSHKISVKYRSEHDYNRVI